MIKTNNELPKKICEFLVLIFYIWYFLPIVNVSLQSGVFKLLFFTCFLSGLFALLFFNGLKQNGLVLIILLYYLVFISMTFLEIDEISKTIRVNFVFFGTAVLYFGVLDERGRKSLGKKILLLFAITAVTSSIGVLMDNSAARTIAHAAADDDLQAAYMMKNIAGIYIFQSFVYFIPMLVCLPKSRKAKWICSAFIVLIFIILLNASFTISLIVSLVALIVSLILRQKGANRYLAFMFAAVIVTILLLNGENLFTYLAEAINNKRVSERIIELRNMLYGGGATGDAELRLELYQISLQTFLKNPFGVGGFYSYITFENGIGYHSQILDDMARFGLFAIAFYIIFFVSYYKLLKREWAKIGSTQIAGLTILIYILFLILNIGFRSSEESVCMFFLIPLIPNLITSLKDRKSRKKEA